MSCTVVRQTLAYAMVQKNEASAKQTRTVCRKTTGESRAAKEAPPVNVTHELERRVPSSGEFFPVTSALPYRHRSGTAAGGDPLEGVPNIRDGRVSAEAHPTWPLFSGAYRRQRAHFAVKLDFGRRAHEPWCWVNLLPMGLDSRVALRGRTKSAFRSHVPDSGIVVVADVPLYVDPFALRGTPEDGLSLHFHQHGTERPFILSYSYFLHELFDRSS